MTKSQITIDEYFMGRRAIYAMDYKPEYFDNAVELLDRVNRLLLYYGDDPGVRSGWRPARINALTPRASPKSLHLVGKAVDLNDGSRGLAEWCNANLDLLAKCELWLENTDSTPSWVHLQSEPPHSGVRVFYP